jgi:endonuclease/exonuclease/phosphatase (EEP) superfamily protein YafD
MNVVVVVAWAAVAAMALLVATQLLGWSGHRYVVGLQALTPYVLGSGLPIGVFGAVTGRWLLAGAALAMLAGLVAIWAPLRTPPAQSDIVADAPTLRVFHGNLLFRNGRTVEMARAVAALDADVLAFTEYTDTHAGGLYVAPLVQAFPHRIEHPEHKAGGSALWSRYPLRETVAPAALYSSTAAVVEAPEPLTIYVVHPPNPLDDLQHWRAELERLAELRRTTEPPSIVVGDFNATPWHPPFRRLLAVGWRDAHHLRGRGFASSWPSDRRWLLPPFLRLDHALVDDSLVVIDVADVELPGSDHLGLVVDVALSRSDRAAPATRSRRLPEGTDGSSTDRSPPRGRSGRTTSPGSAAGSPTPPPAR